MKEQGEWSLLVTAEHGGNEVPDEFRELFRDHAHALSSHRGWDPGTLGLAQSMAEALGATLITSDVTRLLVDLNRSAHNPRVFSEFTRRLPRTTRVSLIERFHQPHWRRCRQWVTRGIAETGRVLHLGVHSFTPVLDGEVRRPDLALLYDPSRALESSLARSFARALAVALPDRVVRRNNPYRGTADGLTTALRKTHPEARYLGIEIEVNQRHVGADGAFPAWVTGTLVRTARDLIP